MIEREREREIEREIEREREREREREGGGKREKNVFCLQGRNTNYVPVGTVAYWVFSY
jgi:hypothetical protein